MIFLLLCLVAEKLVQKKMDEIQDKVHLQQSVEGAYLTHLLLGDQMTVTEILGSITELLLAGVDTVSVAQRGQLDGRCLHEKEEMNSLCSSLTDLQHHLLGSVPHGKESRDPRTAVSGGDKCLPGRQGAKQRRHRRDAVPEGRHQRDAAVRGTLSNGITVFI